jgi:hypothetical protein
MLDCEDRIKSLLAAVFENYKSLDEHSATGLSDIFGPISDCAAPALAPAVQIFSVLNDILSKEAQDILRSYLQVRHQTHFEDFSFGCQFSDISTCLTSNYHGVKHDEGIYISACD